MAITNYMIGIASTTLSGTGTVSATTTALTGAGGSIFLSELYPGVVILAAGQYLAVTAVASNGAATLQSAPSPAISGATFTIVPMTVVSALVADAVSPLGSYYAWIASKHLANGLERSLGRPRAPWLWKNIAATLRTALKVFCPGKSARVYICTLADPSLGTYAAYQAALIWPDSDNAYTPDFVIEFRDLVLL
jgi:hypothetical protein